MSEKHGNQLRLSPQDIMFAKSDYTKNGGVSVDSAIAEFNTIYKVLNDVLRVRDVRRIGIVAEMRYWPNGATPSKQLLSKLFSHNLAGFPAKFNLTFERRYPSNDTTSFDTATDDFMNVIWSLYDSQIDVDLPDNDSFNVNCDVQRYYTPSFKGDVAKEIFTLKKRFDIEALQMNRTLEEVGLLEGSK